MRAWGFASKGLDVCSPLHNHPLKELFTKSCNSVIDVIVSGYNSVVLQKIYIRLERILIVKHWEFLGCFVIKFSHRISVHRTFEIHSLQHRNLGAENRSIKLFSGMVQLINC